MAMRRLACCLAVLAWIGAADAAPSCHATSGAMLHPLFELYTSEGCNSCPPADRWLSALPKRYAPERVVPLALHVDYWDYIGWKDPYAKREFSLRQRKLSLLQRMAMVYTPQVVLQGRDFRSWAGRAFDDAVARINAQPAKARLRLSLLAATPTDLDVEARAELLLPGDRQSIRAETVARAVLELAAELGIAERRESFGGG